MAKTLVFAVYDYDRFSKHDAIGEVRLPGIHKKKFQKNLSFIFNFPLFFALTPSLYYMGPKVSEPKKWLFPNFVFNF